RRGAGRGDPHRHGGGGQAGRQRQAAQPTGGVAQGTEEGRAEEAVTGLGGTGIPAGAARSTGRNAGATEEQSTLRFPDMRWFLLLIVCVPASSACAADDKPVRITVSPSAVELTGARDRQGLIVQAELADGSTRDVTAAA